VVATPVTFASFIEDDSSFVVDRKKDYLRRGRGRKIFPVLQMKSAFACTPAHLREVAVQAVASSTKGEDDGSRFLNDGAT